MLFRISKQQVVELMSRHFTANGVCLICGFIIIIIGVLWSDIGSNLIADLLWGGFLLSFGVTPWGQLSIKKFLTFVSISSAPKPNCEVAVASGELLGICYNYRKGQKTFSLLFLLIKDLNVLEKLNNPKAVTWLDRNVRRNQEQIGDDRPSINVMDRLTAQFQSDPQWNSLCRYLENNMYRKFVSEVHHETENQAKKYEWPKEYEVHLRYTLEQDECNKSYKVSPIELKNDNVFSILQILKAWDAGST